MANAGDQELLEAKNLMDRMTNKLLGAKCAQMDQTTSDRVEAKVNAELTKHDLRDIADTIRKDVFTQRKEDPAPKIVGMVMACIAVISAMTAIITPMNNQAIRVQQELEQDKRDWAESLKHHAEEEDVMMTRLEDRLKEAVRDSEIRMDKLADVDAKDKSDILMIIKEASADVDYGHHQLLEDIEKIKSNNETNIAHNMKIDHDEKRIDKISERLDAYIQNDTDRLISNKGTK
jgi:hypothetical protein